MKIKVHIRTDEIFGRYVMDDGCENIYRDGYSLVATSTAGRRFFFDGVFPDVEEADRAACRLDGCIDDEDPRWREGDPVYGSEEYQRQDCEVFRAWREREEDAWYW